MDFRGWKPPELAKRSGVPLQSIRNYLSGTEPKWLAVVKLADALGVPLEALRDTPPPSPPPVPMPT